MTGFTVRWLLVCCPEGNGGSRSMSLAAGPVATSDFHSGKRDPPWGDAVRICDISTVARVTCDPPFSCPPPPLRQPVLLALPPSTGEPHPSPPPTALPPALPPQAQPLGPEHQHPPPSWPCRLHSAPKDHSNSAACESELSLTPCNPMDCSPPGSSVHGIL